MILFLIKKVQNRFTGNAMAVRSLRWETVNRTDSRHQYYVCFLMKTALEFANEYRAREVIEKYCAFMPVPIFLTNGRMPSLSMRPSKEDQLRIPILSSKQS